jgi:hypothetical protein
MPGGPTVHGEQLGAIFDTNTINTKSILKTKKEVQDKNGKREKNAGR